MGILHVFNNLCPYCKTKLKPRIVYCPRHINIPTLECSHCHIYLYTTKDYHRLKELADIYNRKLNSSVYRYTPVLLSKNKPNQKTKKKRKVVQKQQNKNKKIKTKNLNTSHKLDGLPTTLVPSAYTDNKNIQCDFNKHGHCLYNDNPCRPYSTRCFQYNKRNHRENNNQQLHSKINRNSKSIKQISNSNPSRKTYVTSIVLTYHKKCIKSHSVQDMTGIVKVVNKSGEVKEVKLPIMYCSYCDEYYLLKQDFKNAKNIGVLLCHIVDSTHSQSTSNKSVWNYGNESQIHAMGYNVISNKKYNYTDEQRKVILANILENTNITKQEILSILDMNIARHYNQQNYANAIAKWKRDRTFVEEYKLGDMPSVIIDEMILKFEKTHPSHT